MKLEELVGKKIISVEPIHREWDYLFLAITIEGIAEPVQIEVRPTNFTDVSSVNFTSSCSDG